MPAAVLQAASKSAEGLEGSFQADRFVQLSTQVYVSRDVLAYSDEQLLMVYHCDRQRT